MNKYLSLTSEYIGMIYKNHNKKNHIEFKNFTTCATDYETMSKFYAPLNVSPTYKKFGNIGDYEFGRYYFNELGGLYYKRMDPSPLNAIIVHGWRSSDFNGIEKPLIDPLLAAGCNIYLPVLPYHMERTPEGRYSGENMISADIEMTIGAIQRAVSEVRALISSIKTSDTNSKVFLAGISLGGLIVNLTSCFDKNIDLSSPILYLDSLSFNIWHSRFFRHIKKKFIKSGFSYSDLNEKLNILEPSNWMPKIYKNNILLVRGRYDRFVLYNGILEEKWGLKNEIRTINCGHSGLSLESKIIFANTIDFFKKVF